jgi:hypothetical protein
VNEMMSADKKAAYWFDHKDEWIDYDTDTERYSVKPNAPKKVKESFELWKAKNPKHAA